MAGISKAKEHLKRILGIRNGWSCRKVFWALVSLVILILAVSASTLCLCFRKAGQKGLTTNGVILLACGVVVKMVAYYKANIVAWQSFKAVVTRLF